MEKAWPRFLPESTPEAIAHALIIEASAIVVDQLGEGHRDLLEAHQRAEVFARARYDEDHLDRALAACADQPNNENILLHHLMRFSSTGGEGKVRPPLPLVAPRRGRSALRRRAATARPALAANA